MKDLFKRIFYNIQRQRHFNDVKPFRARTQFYDCTFLRKRLDEMEGVIQDFINQSPNNYDLGEKIRKEWQK